MNPREVEKVVIIGGGCAGLTAAIYTGRAELAPLVFTGPLDTKGGALTKTSHVENFPGFPGAGILGFDLMTRMEAQAIEYGARVDERRVVGVTRSEDRSFTVEDDQGGRTSARALILATGSTPRRLYLPNEERYWGRGISSCAVCDGALYKRRKIAVVGAGDSAMEEALFLTKFSDVTLLVRGAKLARGSETMRRRVLECPKISVRYGVEVTGLRGDEAKLTAVELSTGDTLSVDGLFYGLGSVPAVDAFTGLGLSLLPSGVIDVGSLPPGLFVAGDVGDAVYRQAVVAAGDGCRAALDAERWLAGEEADRGPDS